MQWVRMYDMRVPISSIASSIAVRYGIGGGEAFVSVSDCGGGLHGGHTPEEALTFLHTTNPEREPTYTYSRKTLGAHLRVLVLVCRWRHCTRNTLAAAFICTTLAATHPASTAPLRLTRVETRASRNGRSWMLVGSKRTSRRVFLICLFKTIHSICLSLSRYACAADALTPSSTTSSAS